MLDTGLARPPSPTYTAITPVTRAPERTEAAATTDLPAEETVRPSSETDSSRRSAQDGARQGTREEVNVPPVERRNVVDPKSESLVYVATNTDTGQVVRQIPSETLLRLRAYAETVESQQVEETPSPVQVVV